MHGALGLPLWAIALVLAAVAPVCARAWASVAERRARVRSARVLAKLVLPRGASSAPALPIRKGPV